MRAANGYPHNNMPTVADRNNNPGNIKDPTTGSFKKFSTPQEGYAALLNDLQAKKTGTTTTGVGPSSTLADFSKVYAPAGDSNNPAQYTANLANHMGVRPDAKLSELDVGKWADAVAHAEGYSNAGPPQTSQQTTQNVQPTQDQTSQTPQTDQKGLAQKAAEFLFPILEKKERTPLQTIGDLGLSALTFVPGLGEAGLAAKGLKVASEVAKGVEAVKGVEAGTKAAGLLSKVASSPITKGATIGYGSDVGTKLSQGETDPNKILTPGFGTATGGLLGSAGSLISKISETLPARFVSKYIPKLNSEDVNYALTKPLGSPTKMLAESNTRLDELGNSLGEVLKNPAETYIQPSSPEILKTVANAFPNAGLTKAEVLSKVSALVPLQRRLIQKFISGGDMTIKELHELNSAVGKATFKRVFDDPTVRAGKDVANAFYQATSKVIKDAVPESVPIFDQLTREYALNAGLNQASRSAEKGKGIGLKELLALAAAFTVNPMAGLGLYATEKALTSPTVNLKTAGLLGKVNSGAASKIGKGVLVPSVRSGSLLGQTTQNNK